MLFCFPSWATLALDSGLVMQIHSGNNVIRAIASSILLSFGATTFASGPNFQSILTKGQALGDGWVAESISYHRRGPALAIGGATRLQADPDTWTPAVYYRSSDSSSFNSIWRKPPPADIGWDTVRSHSFQGGLHVGSDRVAFFSGIHEFDSYFGNSSTWTYSTQVTTNGSQLGSSLVGYVSNWDGGEGSYGHYGYSGHQLVVTSSWFSNGKSSTSVGTRSPGYALVKEGLLDESNWTGSIINASRPDVDTGDFLVHEVSLNPLSVTIFRANGDLLEPWRDSPYSFRGSNSLYLYGGGQSSRGRYIGTGTVLNGSAFNPGIGVFGEATATTFVPIAVYGELIQGTSHKFAGGGNFIGEEGDLLVYSADVSANPGVLSSDRVLLGHRNGKSFVMLERGQSMFGSTISSFGVREGSLYNNTITFSYTLADGRSGIAMMNVVPEPGTLAALGLGALLLRRRKR